jgi:hypothetical protein
MFINNPLSREKLLAGSSLSILLDDVAIMSKVGVKKP